MPSQAITPGAETATTTDAPSVLISKRSFHSSVLNGTRIIIILIVLSRVYAFLISLEVVPDYPDPFLAFLAHIYESFDQVIASGLGGVGNLILGNLVFAGLVRWYSAHPGLQQSRASLTAEQAAENEKKGAIVRDSKKKKSGKKGAFGDEAPVESESKGKKPIDLRVGKGDKSLLKRNVVIVARLSQCSVFLAIDLWDGVDVSMRATDLAVTAVIIALELVGVNWDGGMVEAAGEFVKELMLANAAEAEEKEKTALAEAEEVKKLK